MPKNVLDSIKYTTSYQITNKRDSQKNEYNNQQ